MSMQGASSPPWDELLTEIRLLRRDVTRTEEQIWQVVEDLHELVQQKDGAGEAAGRRRAERGSGDSLAPREYRTLKRRLWRLLAATLPEGSRVAVASRGDPDLLDLPGLLGEHFPRNVEGDWAGYYPVDGTACIAHLEWLRAAGAEYLVFPDTARWWLDSFPRFAAHLRTRYPVVSDEDGVGLIHRLETDGEASIPWPERIANLLQAWEAGSVSAPALLDWHTGWELAGRLPGRSVFSPPDDSAHLPYLDGTVDVVAVAGEDPRRMVESRRVARRSVLHLAKRLPGAGGGGGLLLDGPDLAVEHVDGPPPGLPQVSIVIPTHDGIAHLKPCLRALGETLPDNFGEVLVVDDGSGAGTAEELKRLERALPWLRVVRNRTNLGFIGSCNRGAEEARGEILVFLNDDTVPLPGWFRALVMTLDRWPDAGAVGGRLVYPDGRLQEAGCVVYRDGTGANFGRDDPGPDAPIYRYVRPVDYCSGALLATPRDLFRSLGGFDTRYSPAYYEDTDYCFSLRAEGLSIYYQPEATVVHTEGATSGTDPARGVKRYQARNRQTFRRKWSAELEQRPDPPSHYSSLVWHRLALAGGAR